MSEIRAARPDDAAAVAGLLAELGYPADETQVAARLARLAADPASHVLVVEAEEGLAGLASLRVYETIEHDAPVCHLAALVVGERHRRRRLGSELVQAVEAEARRRGCFRVVLTSSRHRDDAHAFYARLGYDGTGRRFLKDLA